MVMLRVFSQQELDSFEPSPKMKLIQPPLTTSDNKERPNVFVESAEDLKIIITPGVGFEEEKDAKLGVKRMGYGGGYYDRFLTQVKEHRASQQSAMPLTVAMALDCQIVQDLPMSESDVRIARLLRE